MPAQDAGSTPVVVPLPAEIDLTTQDRVCDRLYAAFTSGARVVVADFTGTIFCDCSSLRAVLAVRGRAAARNAQLVFAIPPGGPVHRLAQLMGLDRLVRVYPGAGEAAKQARPDAGEATGSLARRRAEPVVADIIDLIWTDHRHIRHWAAWLGELDHQDGDRASHPELVMTWQTLAALIDLHMLAEDEICGPAVFGTGPQGRAAARQARDDHEDIREIIRETSLQQPGSPLWWRLATAAVSAWTSQADRQEHRILPDFAARTGAAQREALCRQWRAFMEARIRDQIPDAPSRVAACQLRRTRRFPGVPQVAAVIFDPLSCTCPDCDKASGRILPVLSVRQRQAPPRPLASSAAPGSLAPPAAPGLPVVRISERVIARVVGDGYADMANVQLLDPASRALRIIAQDGFRSQFLEFFEIVRGEESACGLALAQARPVWVPDVARSPVFAGTAAEQVMLGAGSRSVASVPVLAKDGHLIAMISAHRREPGPWTDPQRRHLEGLAAQTGRLLSRW